MNPGVVRACALALLLVAGCSNRSVPSDSARGPAGQRTDRAPASGPESGDRTSAQGSTAAASSQDAAGQEPEPQARRMKENLDKKKQAVLAAAPQPAPTAAVLPGKDQDVLAWSAERKISRDDFLRYLKRIPPFQAREYQSNEKKVELLKNYIRFETLADRARKDGVEDDPELQLAIKTEIVRWYMERKFGDGGEAPVSDQEIDARYQKDIAVYQKPEKVRASHILLSDRAAADALLESLKGAMARPDASPRTLFRDAVAAHSQDEATKSRGGDLLFFSREGVNDAGQSVDPAVVEAAFAMQNTDQLSAVVQGKDGFHILLVTNRRPAVNRPLPEVREEIRGQIRREILDRKRRELMDGLVDDAAWHIDQKKLSDIRIEVPGPLGEIQKRMTPPEPPHPESQ